MTVIEPGYRQVRGIAENLGCAVDVVQLTDENGWELDLDELRAKVGPKTKLLAVVNPNNPTGTIFSAEARAAILDVVESTRLLAPRRRGVSRLGARRRRDASRSGARTRGRRVNSLSKAYGLCGLRIGWVVAPQPLADELRRRHEYAVISASLPSVFLAERALAPRSAGTSCSRASASSCATAPSCTHVGSTSTQSSSRRSRRRRRRCRFHATPLRSRPSRSPTRSARARRCSSCPGSMMGSEGHLRLTVGFERDFLGEALDRIASVLAELA